MFSVKGPKGEVKKLFQNPRLEIKAEGDKITIKCESKNTTVRDKRSINSIESHIKNLLIGVVEGYHAKVKVLSGHFPMTANIEGNVVSVKNFLGEKVPRKTTIMPGVKAVIQGDIISLDGIDKEAVAQSAAKIETMTRITNKDRRVFQDGCYIIEKPGNRKI
ncbi:MAG: 50S ribosomal protein L6 [archaeon]|nr:50S ribosomal protein L6 [archaeon]